MQLVGQAAEAAAALLSDCPRRQGGDDDDDVDQRSGRGALSQVLVFHVGAVMAGVAAVLRTTVTGSRSGAPHAELCQALHLLPLLLSWLPGLLAMDVGAGGLWTPFRRSS